MPTTTIMPSLDELPIPETESELDSVRYLTKSGTRYVSLARHERMCLVHTLLVGGVSLPTIVNRVVKMLKEANTVVSRDAIRADIDLIYANWQFRDGERLPIVKAQAEEMYLAGYRLAMGKGQVSAAMRAVDGFVRLNGLHQPEQHAHLVLRVNDGDEYDLDDLNADLAKVATRVDYKKSRLARASARIAANDSDVIDVTPE